MVSKVTTSSQNPKLNISKQKGKEKINLRLILLLLAIFNRQEVSYVMPEYAISFKNSKVRDVS